MEIFIERTAEIRKEKKFLEEELGVKISIKGNQVSFEGDPLDEYEAERILEAINSGFSARTAILLKDEEFSFEKISIKDFTKRKDLETVRSRIIGTKGKTRKTLEEISGCKIKIRDNHIGVIGPAEAVEYAKIAIGNIVRGSKQKNAYKYLERINAKRKK